MEIKTVQLDERTEQALEELFNTEEIRKDFIKHYMKLAVTYKEVISEIPLEKPKLEEFRSIIFDTFLLDVARTMFRLKSTVLFNLTVAEEQGLTYSEIQKMITNVLLDAESQLNDMASKEEVSAFYLKQMKELRS